MNQKQNKELSTPSPKPAALVGNDTEARITQYLSVGGLWNPEMMEHDKVRDLLIDCRTELASLRSIISKKDEALKWYGERVDKLLEHCGDAECEECAKIICPFKDELHFHHDGCPSCATAPQDHPARRIQNLLEALTPFEPVAKTEEGELKRSGQEDSSSRQWVSVDERLPNAEGAYLIYCAVGRAAGNYFNKAWGMDVHQKMMGRVTHWMEWPDKPTSSAPPPVAPK